MTRISLSSRQLIKACLVSLIAASISLGQCQRLQAAESSMHDLVEKMEADSSFEISNDLISRIDKELQSDPNNVAAHFAMAICYQRLGMKDLARQQIIQAVKLGPDDPNEIVSLLRVQLKFGDWKSTAEAFEEAYKRFPNDPQLMFWHANYIAHMGDRATAAPLFDRAIKMNPNIQGLYTAVAELYFEKGDYFNASLQADKELRLDKAFWGANFMKGSALLMMGDIAQARKPLSIAYYQDIYRPEIASRYAFCCAWNGLYRDALDPALISLCQRATLPPPSRSPQAQNRSSPEKRLLIKIIRNLPPKIVAERLTSVGKNLDERYHNAAFHFAMGDVLDTVGMREAAIDQYHAGLAIAPDYARGIFRLGQDLELSSREYTEALHCYERAHQLAPYDEEITKSWMRLSARMENRKSDLAWNLKDWFHHAQLRTSGGE